MNAGHEKLAELLPLVKRKRTVSAPSPYGVLGSSTVISVELAEDEEIVWHWTHFADGRSLVTGYTIIQAPAPDGDSRPRPAEQSEE